ncbi:hypothetical protein MASR1M12_45110 [Erysipelotrichia bacterium]
MLEGGADIRYIQQMPEYADQQHPGLHKSVVENAPGSTQQNPPGSKTETGKESIIFI